MFKKILSFISIVFITILILNKTIAWEQVVVSAIVWSINTAPLIIDVNPNDEPWILERSNIQNYSIYFKDKEKDVVYYTITPLNWFANPISWVIDSSDYDTSSWAYIRFVYLRPSWEFPDEKITVTLNDIVNVVNRDLSLYIY